MESVRHKSVAAALGSAPGDTTGKAKKRSIWAIDVGRLAFLVGMVTASFDIFMVINVKGFALRPYQILLPISLAYALGQAFSDKKLRAPLGILALIVWILFILSFVPNTPLLLRSAGYAVWLLLDALVIVLAVQLFDNLKWMTILLRWYLGAYLFISAVGLAQFVLGVAHLPAPYVRQWVFPGIWPRINAFTFEPSYFATYLIMGWVLSAWLVERRSDILPKRLLHLTFYASTLALILATSRLGWAMMMLWGAGYACRRVQRFAPIHLSLRTWALTVNAVVLLTAGAAVLAVYKADRVFELIAAGTGLFGTPSHTVQQRQNVLHQTIGLFKKSPLVGYSLGGIAPALGAERWERVQSQEAAKSHEGMNIFVEVLTASGIIGFIPFVVYILTLLIAPFWLARRCGEPYRPVLTGLVWGLVMEFIILQFNQNILRPYIWFHIAVLSSVYAVVKDQMPKKKFSVHA
jgi:O-antigen ligase